MFNGKQTVAAVFGCTILTMQACSGGGGDTPPPTGEAHFERDAQGQLRPVVTGANGGAEILTTRMNEVLSAVDSELATRNAALTQDGVLVPVAARMPVVTIYSWSSDQSKDANGEPRNYYFVLTYPDPQTGVNRQVELSRYDLVRHYTENLDYPEALIPQWQYQHLMARYGQEQEFQTEGQWAVDEATVLADANGTRPQDPQQAALVGTGYQRLTVVAVDLGNDGVVTTALPATVSNDLRSLQGDGVARFDADNDGFLEPGEWLGTQEAFLAIDRDGNDAIDAASELFNAVYTAVDRRGSATLAYYDANQDGRLDRNDPAFSRLRLWLDLDGDGAGGSQELMDMDRRAVGVDKGILPDSLRAEGADSKVAPAGLSPVDHIDLSTLTLHFQGGGSAGVQDITLQSLTQGIVVEYYESIGNLIVVDETGHRDGYVTRIESLASLQELRDPNISEERRNYLLDLARRVGLDPDAPDFMTIVDGMTSGGGNVTEGGAT